MIRALKSWKVYLQPLVVCVYFTIYMLVLDGDRDLMALGPVVLFALILDALVKRLIRGRWEFPLPGITTGVAAALILRSIYDVWPYYFAVAVGILSKPLLRDSRGCHIFNPAALGIFAAVAFFPSVVNIHLRQWPIPSEYYLFMLCLAICVTIVNDKWRLTLSYLGVVIVLRALWSYFTNHSYAYGLGVILSQTTLIFAFHMITDPRTSPRCGRGQLLFGTLIGVVDFCIRWAELPFSAIIALCLVTAAINPWRDRWAIMRGA